MTINTSAIFHNPGKECMCSPVKEPRSRIVSNEPDRHPIRRGTYSGVDGVSHDWISGTWAYPVSTLDDRKAMLLCISVKMDAIVNRDIYTVQVERVLVPKKRSDDGHYISRVHNTRRATWRINVENDLDDLVRVKRNNRLQGFKLVGLPPAHDLQ